MDKLIENLPKGTANNKYYIDYTGGTNAFRIRKDKDQVNKEHWLAVIAAVDGKLTRSTGATKADIARLKATKNQGIKYYEELGEKYVK